jgi:hypothetical protein
MVNCYLCGSDDTMRPFKKQEEVFFLSLLLPIRWRFCRSCYRHFIVRKRPAVAVSRDR